MTKMHPFHMVSMSPWPFVAAFGAFSLTCSLSIWMHTKLLSFLSISLLSLILGSYSWWRDVSRETNFEGLHPSQVIKGLKIGMIFFISSEVLFFFSFFWAFFQSSIAPNIELGENWPPNSITAFNPLSIPLMNTILLLSSGVSVTWSHHALMENKMKTAKRMLLLTVVLGALFTLLQALEYNDAPFSISDSSYGSVFFAATGFHGLHVLIGSTFLLICLSLLNEMTLTHSHIVGFETAAWYWHFVDVVWLFLYTAVYWWGL